ncbi:MAG: cupin domain-containing protein [Oscillospiraceae bacterium]
MNISEELIKEIVAKVCENMKKEDSMPFERNVLSNGMMSIKTDTVECGPFPFDIGAANKDVSLLDVVTLEESPNLGVGVMELKNGTEFPWTLNYDEVEYVIDGTIVLKSEAGDVTAHAGDMTFIPKGTSIHFSTPDHVRFIYISYPADWANQ